MEDLIKQARAVVKHSYSPFSGFAVGAAVMDEQGRIYTGVNVENSSYGLTQCAERSAICTAVGAGARKITAVVVYTPTDEPNLPCGACRQVIREFGADAKILSVCDTEARAEYQMDTLLPAAFVLGDDQTDSNHE